jgi:hypothetical protein
MIKLILIFIAGLIETYLYTGWCLKANQGKVWVSSILMVIYMIMYLTIISYAIKDSNTLLIILIYSLSCGAGNFIRVGQEKNEKNNS